MQLGDLSAYVKDFNEDEHCTCPECGFEVLYLNVLCKSTAYLYKTGLVDTETYAQESDMCPDDHDKVVCNRVGCNFNAQYDEFMHRIQGD